MKIGILTFTNTLNYGALLQAYALQYHLSCAGHEVEVIDYENSAISEKEFTKKSKFTLSPKKLYKQLKLSKPLANKKEKFDEFEHKYVKHSKMKYNEANFADIENYDLIVVGSDQVWNMKITHNDLNYFLPLNNPKIKKISYAASFGNVEFPKEFIQSASELLKSFCAVSVREKSGKQKLKNIYSENAAAVVVDPTLLLGKEQWFKLNKFRPELEHYILVYFPHDKKLAFDFVAKLKKQTGLPVIYISISPKPQSGVKTIYDASPDEFLGWIRYADYVVTGSFHGTAFSINMEKQFFFEHGGENTRIGDLVKQCGLENRSIKTADLNEKINYADVNSKLIKLRDDSIEWLKNSLNESEVLK